MTFKDKLNEYNKLKKELEEKKLRLETLFELKEFGYIICNENDRSEYNLDESFYEVVDQFIFASLDNLKNRVRDLHAEIEAIEESKVTKLIYPLVKKIEYSRGQLELRYWPGQEGGEITIVSNSSSITWDISYKDEELMTLIKEIVNNENDDNIDWTLLYLNLVEIFTRATIAMNLSEEIARNY